MEKCGTPNEGRSESLHPDSYPGVTKLPFYTDLIRQNHERTLRQYIHTCSSHALEPELVDLIDKMLVVYPGSRISAEEALKHPYFKSYPEPAPLEEYSKSLK